MPLLFGNNPLASKLALLESNPPVNKLTSPLNRGDKRVFQYILFSLHSCLPCVGGGGGRVARRRLRSEPEGLNLKKGGAPKGQRGSPFKKFLSQSLRKRFDIFCSGLYAHRRVLDYTFKAVEASRHSVKFNRDSGL